MNAPNLLEIKQSSPGPNTLLNFHKKKRFLKTRFSKPSNKLSIQKQTNSTNQLKILLNSHKITSLDVKLI